MARVMNFKNRHKGERIVIAGNGPSLAKLDLSKIDCPSFGVNRIWEHKTWAPTYYCTESKKFVRAAADKLLRYDGPRFKFVANRCRQYLDSPKLGSWKHQAAKNVVWVNMSKGHSPVAFSTKCQKEVCHGMNVIYMALQLAFWMGARQVVLVGVDFDYPDGPIPAKHFYDNTVQQGVPMDNTHKAIAIAHYQHAHKLLNSGPKPRIVNATPGSKLDVFPQVAFKDLF